MVRLMSRLMRRLKRRLKRMELKKRKSLKRS